MSFLNTLTFTTANDLTPPPIEKKRHQLVAALKDQLALLEDPTLSRTRRKWLEVDGERILTQKSAPVRPWWKETLDGKVMFLVRSGVKRIEFEKGKAAIIVTGMSDLPKLIKGLIDATHTGELDHLLIGKVEPSPNVKKKAA